MNKSPSIFRWMFASIPIAAVIITFTVALVPSIRLLPELQNTKWKHVWGRLESVEEPLLDSGDPRVTYTYEVDGKAYEGDTLYVYSYVRETDRKNLTGGLNKPSGHRQVGVKYDVDDPSRSALNSNFDFEAVMQTVMMQMTFCAIAFALACAILVWGVGGEDSKAVKARYPSEPWNWNASWREGVIKTSTGCFCFIAMPLGFFAFTLTIIPTLVNTLNARSFGLGTFSLVLPTIGLLFLIPGMISFFGSRKFGNMAFHLSTMPGVKGGQLSGVLVIPKALPADAVQFSLRCDETRLKRGGGSNGPSTSTSPIWTDDASISEFSVATSRHTEVPVCFNIPYDVQPTSMHENYPNHSWHLRVAADIPGLDLVGEFEVPVFETADSDPDFDPDSCSSEYVETQDQRSADDVIRMAAQQKILITGSETALEIYMGGFQNTAVSIAMPILTLVTVFVPPMSLILFGYWMNVWFGSYRLRIDEHYVYYSHRVFGIGPSKTIPITEVVDITATMYGRSAYKLEVELADGKIVKMLPWIEGKRDAKAIGQLILAYCE